MILSDAYIEAVLESDDREAIERLHLLTCHPYYGFEPRPDRPNDHEEQTSFWEAGYHFDEALNRYVYDEPAVRFKICLGGTGSGKTVCAAHKTAKHVLEIRPPEYGAKFWVISHTKEQVGGVCWKEKLSGMIPENEIHGISWSNERRGFPASVALKHPDDYRKIGWVLEFKSYEQGLSGFTGANIGGYWFNEEVPFALVAEVMGRTRQWGSPGWADFTPIECRDQEWPEKYHQPPEGWRFYHLNSRLNYYNAPGWYESQKAHWPEDTIELRTIGKFTALHGAIFKEFRRHIHVIDWDQFHEITGKRHIPREWQKRRGMDFGFNNPTCCLWGARNRDGVWFIYDEHYRAQASVEEHAREIQKRDWDDAQPWYGPTYSDHEAQTINTYGKLGIHCTPAVKRQNEAIDYVRSLMMLQANEKPKLYILEDCRNLIRELPAWRWKEGTDGRDPRDEPVDKNDHSCDALLYMIFSDFMSYQKANRSGFKKRPNYGRHGVQMPGTR